MRIQRLQQLMQAGNEAAATGQYDEALRQYDAVVQQFPEFATTEYARLARGLMLYQLGRTSDAILQVWRTPGAGWHREGEGTTRAEQGPTGRQAAPAPPSMAARSSCNPGHAQRGFRTRSWPEAAPSRSRAHPPCTLDCSLKTWR